MNNNISENWITWILMTAFIILQLWHAGWMKADTNPKKMIAINNLLLIGNLFIVGGAEE